MGWTEHTGIYFHSQIGASSGFCPAEVGNFRISRTNSEFRSTYCQSIDVQIVHSWAQLEHYEFEQRIA